MPRPSPPAAVLGLLLACTPDKDPQTPVTAGMLTSTAPPATSDDPPDEPTTTAADTTTTSGVDPTTGDASTTGTSSTTDPTTTAGDTTASLSHDVDIAPIWGLHCTNCHRVGGSAESTGVILTADEAYAAIVGVPSASVPGLALVEPGVPEASYLMHKLWGTHTEFGGVGLQMPLGGELPVADVDRIAAWIGEGAPP